MYRLRADGLIWRSFDGEAVVLDTQQSRYLAVNETASVLWPLLAEGAERDALVAALTAAFEVDDAQAGNDVDLFLEELRARQLLEE